MQAAKGLSPAVLTPAEVADALRVSRSAVYDGLAAGTIPGFQIGARWVVPADELWAWMRERSRANLHRQGTGVGASHTEDAG